MEILGVPPPPATAGTSHAAPQTRPTGQRQPVLDMYPHYCAFIVATFSFQPNLRGLSGVNTGTVRREDTLGCKYFNISSHLSEALYYCAVICLNVSTSG